MPARSFRVRLGNYVVLVRMLDKGRFLQLDAPVWTRAHSPRQFLGFDPGALLKELATAKQTGTMVGRFAALFLPRSFTSAAPNRGVSPLNFAPSSARSVASLARNRSCPFRHEAPRRALLEKGQSDAFGRRSHWDCVGGAKSRDGPRQIIVWSKFRTEALLC